MITDGFQSWILHKHWSGDTSARVIFFSRERGVISAHLRGGRTPKKQSLLQAFTPLWLILDVRGEWYYVRQLDTQGISLPLRGDALFAALYVNEIIYRGFHFNDPCPALFDAYIQVLHTLSLLTQRSDIEVILRQFEWQFLSACGYGFSLTHEAITQTPIVFEHYYHYIQGQGFIRAASGVQGKNILAMADNRLDSPDVLKSAKWIMRQAIDHALHGKKIMARELYGKSVSKLKEQQLD